jgi:hypothetical protein
VVLDAPLAPAGGPAPGVFSGGASDARGLSGTSPLDGFTPAVPDCCTGVDSRCAPSPLFFSSALVELSPSSLAAPLPLSGLLPGELPDGLVGIHNPPLPERHVPPGGCGW